MKKFKTDLNAAATRANVGNKISGECFKTLPKLYDQHMKTTVLIIEDDPKIAELIQLYCDQEGFRNIHASSGPEGLELALKVKSDAIILDRMLPGMEGLEVLKQIRASQNTPVLLVTAKADEIERIIGLEMGADDYIAKPFSPKELMARVKAILRRQGHSPSGEVLHHGPLRLDPARMELTLDDDSIELSVLEFKLIQIFMQAPGQVFSREALMQKIYNSNALVFDRTIDAHIKNLRKKLGDDPKKARFLETVYGAGYKLKMT